MIAPITVLAGALGSAFAAQDIETLIRLVRSRDAMLSSLELPFESRHRVPVRGEAPWFASGTLSWQGGQMAVERTIGWEGDGLRLEKGVFDGVRLQLLTREAGGGHPVLTLRAGQAEPFSTYLPHNFGLRHLGRPWPEVLESGGSLQVLGHEEVAGRDCLQLLFDEAPGAEGEYARPVLCWIDTEETLLVLRSQTHMLFEGHPSLESSAEDAERVALQWSGKRFIPYLRWEVEEVAELQPGLWIATRGRQSFPAAPQLLEVVTTVDLSRTRSGQVLPESVFRIELPTGTHIDDQLAGEQRHAADESGVTGYDVGFEGVLGDLARSDGLRPVVREPLEPQPWERSSCGPNALYLVLRMLGADIRLSEILAVLPASEGEETSIESLSAAARRFGYQARAVEMTPHAFERHDGNLIALIRAAEGEPGHFVVARARENGVRLVSPPEAVETTSLEEFSRLWTGKALLVSMPSRGRASPVRIALLAASALLALAAFAIPRPRRIPAGSSP